ncbi:MAG TPA: nicotinamide-nucleotide amidohydrolase family protein [Gammaproteobacteria bacterium]|nr:nicotinamide-nucleotide amidohydrolase family protein [Gammaproteobacteria bacterium]
MDTDDIQLAALAEQLGRALAARKWRLATAESCTGGWIAKLMTDYPGSSSWLERGFVTYSNPAKIQMLGVSEATLDAHGAVSEATVREMAAGALARSEAHITCAVSGIAGPNGGSDEKPVGTVWLGWAWQSDRVEAKRLLLKGGRDHIRRQTVAVALAGVLERVQA